MKKIILYALLYSGAIYSQDATVHFFYGSNELVGAEVMMEIKEDGSQKYLGFGFSGATNQHKAKGKLLSGDATDWDRQRFNNRVHEQWCSLYSVGSLGYFKSLLVKAKLGLGIYNQIDNFKGLNPSNLSTYDYHKKTGLSYLPVVGASVMYALTDNYGVEIGGDYFNGASVGFSVIF